MECTPTAGDDPPTSGRATDGWPLPGTTAEHRPKSAHRADDGGAARALADVHGRRRVVRARRIRAPTATACWSWPAPSCSGSMRADASRGGSACSVRATSSTSATCDGTGDALRARQDGRANHRRSIDVASGERLWSFEAPAGTFIGEAPGFKVEAGAERRRPLPLPDLRHRRVVLRLRGRAPDAGLRWHRTDLPFDAGLRAERRPGGHGWRRPARTAPLEPDRQRLPRATRGRAGRRPPRSFSAGATARSGRRSWIRPTGGSAARPVRGRARRAARQRAAVRAAPGGTRSSPERLPERGARQLPGRGIRGPDAPDAGRRPGPSRRLVRREGLAGGPPRAAAAADVGGRSARRRPAAAGRRAVAGRAPGGRSSWTRACGLHDPIATPRRAATSGAATTSTAMAGRRSSRRARRIGRHGPIVHARGLARQRLPPRRRPAARRRSSRRSNSPLPPDVAFMANRRNAIDVALADGRTGVLVRRAGSGRDRRSGPGARAAGGGTRSCAVAAGTSIVPMPPGTRSCSRMPPDGSRRSASTAARRRLRSRSTGAWRRRSPGAGRRGRSSSSILPAARSSGGDPVDGRDGVLDGRVDRRTAPCRRSTWTADSRGWSSPTNPIRTGRRWRSMPCPTGHVRRSAASALPAPVYLGIVPVPGRGGYVVNLRTGVHTMSVERRDRAGRLRWRDPTQGRVPAAAGRGCRRRRAGRPRPTTTASCGGTTRPGRLPGWPTGPRRTRSPCPGRGARTANGRSCARGGIHGLELVDADRRDDLAADAELWEYASSTPAVGWLGDPRAPALGAMTRGGAFECIDVRTGRTRWATRSRLCRRTRRRSWRLTSTATAADEFIVGLPDGRLVCLGESASGRGVDVAGRSCSTWRSAIRSSWISTATERAELVVATADGAVRWLCVAPVAVGPRLYITVGRGGGHPRRARPASRASVATSSRARVEVVDAARCARRWIAPVADDPDYENLYDRFYAVMTRRRHPRAAGVRGAPDLGPRGPRGGGPALARRDRPRVGARARCHTRTTARPTRSAA